LGAEVMGWIIKIGGRVVGHVTDELSVLEPRIATLIENCLLAFGVKTYLGDEERTPVTYGFRVVGPSPDKTAVAIKRCIAHVLHRRPIIVEEKIYVVEGKVKTEGGEKEHEELFEEG
jgi:hypothetical protein